jgi:hypothetical protein
LAQQAESVLRFVRRGGILLQRGKAIHRLPAALLGRFLPRLGPLAPASGPFFVCGALAEMDCGLNPGSAVDFLRQKPQNRAFLEVYFLQSASNSGA